ncbi:MAG: YdcF family protein [Alphaproteobacteria bacterium]|nr:YdcF family protein [Alphaproteobacteria bacterium]
MTGLVWFATTIPDAVEDDFTRSDAIVVLTGGKDRLQTGFDLLRHDMAESLFVSGVHTGIELGSLARVIANPPHGLAGRITLGHAADNTKGNALETAEWMAARGYHSLRLVTAAYHMQRSLLEFHHAMPDVTIIPHPVFPLAVKQEEWWRWPGTATLIATEYTKYLFATVRNWLANWPLWRNSHDRR